MQCSEQYAQNNWVCGTLDLTLLLVCVSHSMMEFTVPLTDVHCSVTQSSVICLLNFLVKLVLFYRTTNVPLSWETALFMQFVPDSWLLLVQLTFFALVFKVFFDRHACLKVKEMGSSYQRNDNYDECLNCSWISPSISIKTHLSLEILRPSTCHPQNYNLASHEEHILLIRLLYYPQKK